MSMTDPIADYLTKIRNALKAKKRYVDIPASNLKRDMSQILMEQQAKTERFHAQELAAEIQRQAKEHVEQAAFANTQLNNELADGEGLGGPARVFATV